MAAERPAHPLDALFRPRSVAVIGASRRRGSIGGELFHNLIQNGFNGAVYPVNPVSDVVHSVRAYPDVREIPDPVDLAVIVVPAEQVLEVVDACGEKGVKAIVVITAGFGETGPSGKALQDELVRRVRGHGMRMVGPNCLGLINRDPDVNLDATFGPAWPPFGTVAISSQSGALGLAILEYARDLGIGVSQFVSIGNKADVSGNDLLEYWEHDPLTRVVLLYLESFGNPRRFMRVARRVARTKPIIAVKSGRTEAGARAASSHTGALAGLDVAVDALMWQAGVIRTASIEELFDVAMLLASQPVPRGRRVGILTNAGGPGIMASDACESRGLTVPPLQSETEVSLRAFLPAEASVRNPVDMIASAPATSYERALRLMLADPGLDAVIVLFVPPVVTEATDVAGAIRAGAAGSKKPVLTCFMGKHGVPPALSSLREGRFPSYAFPEGAAIALSLAVRHGEWLDRPDCPFVAANADTVARAHAVLGRGHGERWLSPEDVRELLDLFGIAIPAQSLATSAAEATAAAERVGLPVALKVVSDTLVHKTEVGGVILGLKTPAEVRDAFAALAERLGASMQGALVQAMVPHGVETFVGMTQDPTFGPLLGFGIGGVNVEVWRDVVFRVNPIGEVDAAEMLQEIRGRRLLEGFRGAPPADRDALVQALLAVSRLVDACPEIAELDLNPLIALAPGRGVVAVDARIRVAMADG